MKKTAGPAILILDIETSPDVVFCWGVYEQNAIEVLDHWYVLSFAAQWYKQGPVFCKGLDDYKGYKGGNSTERKLLKEVHQLIDQADIVVAHNGKKFDMRKLNARFIAHGFQPPSPYKVVDTKQELSAVAAFSSNRLDWLCKQLDIGHKVEHEGFPMWRGCMNGNAGAWKKMKKYNKHDVHLLRELYEGVSPWIRQPNAAVWGMECTNPACREGHLVARGFQRTKTRVYQRYQCQSCGTWSQSVLSEKTPKATVK